MTQSNPQIKVMNSYWVKCDRSYLKTEKKVMHSSQKVTDWCQYENLINLITKKNMASKSSILKQLYNIE